MHPTPSHAIAGNPQSQDLAPSHYAQVAPQTTTYPSNVTAKMLFQQLGLSGEIPNCTSFARLTGAGANETFRREGTGRVFTATKED
jgi:hypothetical protein